MLSRASLRTVIGALGTLWLIVHVHTIHRWFSVPFRVWAGWDEAYISAFGERMLAGRWLPYVDAVSHRGPVLYWIGAALQALGTRMSLAPMRFGALMFAELNVVLAFLVGAVVGRPVAGFLSAAVFVTVTAHGMEPKDGIGFNGELVATPFILLATCLAFVARPPRYDGSNHRIWLAAGCGVAAVLAGLSKQVAFVHLLPLGLVWLATAMRQREDSHAFDYRPLVAFTLGALTPLLGVFAFYLRSGQLETFVYYFYTYNREVYLGPVTLGYALESSYLFTRDHIGLVVMTAVGIAWGFARWIGASETWSPRAILLAYDRTAVTSTSTLHLLLAVVGAFSTFRFWEHYFITALPWFGLLGGIVVERALMRARQPRIERASAFMVASIVVLFFVLGRLTLLWLDGERRLGRHGNPVNDPINVYVTKHSSPTDRIFVWGFAADIYTSSGRRPASRFLYSTFVAGVVPWFTNTTLEKENAYSVAGSRALLIHELETSRAGIILDINATIMNRGMRRYPELAAYLDRAYCYDQTVVGFDNRRADIYRRRLNAQPCAHPPPPLEDPSSAPPPHRSGPGKKRDPRDTAPASSSRW